MDAISEWEFSVADTTRYPYELTKWDQWMCQEEKRPVAPWSTADNIYSWSNPENWTTSKEARAYASKRLDLENCYAFISQKQSDPYQDPERADYFLMVDGDNVRDPETGAVLPEFRALLERLGPTFCEVSRSGNGIHAYYRGELPADHAALQFPLTDDADGPHVEIYDGKRVFVVTGNHIEDSPGTVRRINDGELAELAETYGTDRGSVTHDPDAEPREFDADPNAVRDQQVTTEFENILAVVADLSVHKLPMRSECTKKRADGTEDWNPSWEPSDSGKRLMIGENGHDVYYRAGDIPGDALDLIAWEESITRPGDQLTGRDFFNALDAARDRGASIPRLVASDSPAVNSDSDQSDAAQNRAEPAQDNSMSKGPPETTDANSDAVSAQSKASDLSDPWATVRYMFGDSDFDSGTALNQAAEALMDDHHIVTLNDAETMWVYNAKTGIFEPKGRLTLREHLTYRLGGHLSGHNINEIIDRVEERTLTDRDDFGGPPGLIATRDGVVDISNPEHPKLVQHHPGFCFHRRFEVPVDLTPPSEFSLESEAPEFAQFLDETVRDEDRLKLQEYAGYMLHTWAQPYKRALVCVGPTDSGKSTFLNIMQAIAGADNVANESLHRLVNSRWGTNSLFGAIANIRNELSGQELKNHVRVKELTSGQDAVHAEEKGQPGFEFVPVCKYLFATNRVPQVDDADDAFHNRWLFVSFPNSIPTADQDRGLADRILDRERAGVFNWLLEGYARLRAQDRFSSERTIAEKEEMWAAFGDSVDRFIQNCIEATGDLDDVLPKEYLYDAYIDFADDKGLERVRKAQLTQRLAKETGISDARRTIGGERFRSYVGLKLTKEGARHASGAVETWVKAQVDADDDSDDDGHQGAGLQNFSSPGE